MKKAVLVSIIISVMISMTFCLCFIIWYDSRNSIDYRADVTDFSLSDNLIDNDRIVNGFLCDDGSMDASSHYFCTDFIDISMMQYLPAVVEYYDGEWIYADDVRWSTYDGNKEKVCSGGQGATREITVDEKFVRYCLNIYDFCNDPMIIENTKAEDIIGSNRLDEYIPEKSTFEYHQELNKHIGIVLPQKIVTSNSVEFHMYYDNILKGYCSDNLVDKKITGLKSNSHEAFLSEGNSLEGINNCNVVFDFCYSKSGGTENLIDGTTLVKSFDLISVDRNKGAGHTRNVMLFGDSITAYGIYPEELKRLFEDDPMDVVLLGTLGRGGNPGDTHEGRGGWGAGTYLSQQEFNGYNNAFFNPDTQEFDFAYYMNNNGFDTIDDFVILLGINDIDRKTCPSIIDDYNAIIGQVREFNPNCNILIGLPILPCQMEYAIESKVVSLQKQKNRRLELWQYLIDEYDNREDEGYYVMPVGICVDSRNDFDVVEQQLSDRNNTMVNVPVDTVHPSEAGFYKIADMVYSYIKYAD